jgi:hypothetical protein
MRNGQFCFIDDTYYKKFPNHGVMENKQKDSGGNLRDRPCFFVFEDATHEGIFWLIPISSQYEKYKKIYEHNIEKYGRCSFIRFGEVLGKHAAFLIQNICPVTKKYIREVYVDKNNNPVKIDNRIVRDVVSNAKVTLAKANRGAKIVFTKFQEIKNELLIELENE